MIKQLLARLKKNTSVAPAMLTAQTAFSESGVYEFLREAGRAKDIHPSVPNYMEVQAMQTAWSVGYNQCLDHIMLFRETFLEADLERDSPKMSFGGLDLALFKDDLTKEEANAIRNGEPVPKLGTQHPRKTKKR